MFIRNHLYSHPTLKSLPRPDLPTFTLIASQTVLFWRIACPKNIQMEMMNTYTLYT